MVRNEEIQTNVLVSAIELDNFEKNNGSNWGCELRLTLGFCACGDSPLASTSKQVPKTSAVMHGRPLANIDPAMI